MNRVREVRVEKGMAQYELATRANVSPSWIVIIEKYGHVPGKPIRRRLADALGVSEAVLWPPKELMALRKEPQHAN